MRLNYSIVIFLLLKYVDICNNQVKYARDLDIPSSRGAWLIGFLSIMSTVGRVIFGKICELRCANKLYVYQFSVLAIGVSSVLCPLTRSYAGLLTYSLVFGFFDGCFVGQVAVITGDIAGKRRLSQAVGNMFGVIAIPMALGPPVAGKMFHSFRRMSVCLWVKTRDISLRKYETNANCPALESFAHCQFQKFGISEAQLRGYIHFALLNPTTCQLSQISRESAGNGVHLPI